MTFLCTITHTYTQKHDLQNFGSHTHTHTKTRTPIHAHTSICIGRYVEEKQQIMNLSVAYQRCSSTTRTLTRTSYLLIVYIDLECIEQ